MDRREPIGATYNDRAWSASQMIAVLLQRLGEPQTVTYGELAAFGCDLPTRFTFDGDAVTLTVDPPRKHIHEEHTDG